MGKTDLDLGGESLVVKVDKLTSALNELNLKPNSPGDYKFEEGKSVKEDSDKDSGHEDVSDTEEEERTGRSAAFSKQLITTSAPQSTASDSEDEESEKDVPSAESDAEEEDEKHNKNSHCTLVQSTKNTADSVSIKKSSSTAAVCDISQEEAVNRQQDEAAGEDDEATADKEDAKDQSKAATAREDAGAESDDDNESDEDNESVVIPDVGVKASATGAVSRLTPSTPVDDVVYQDRGPCKVPRSHSVSARYNPMSAASEPRDCDASYSYGGLGSPTPALTAPSYYLPLTPPYTSDDVLQDDLLDTSPFTDAEMSALQMSPTQGYNTPNYAPTPIHNTDYSPSYTINGGPSYAMSYSGGSLSNSSEAFGFNYEGGALDDIPQQLADDGLLTANYLDALDSAVAKTVGEGGACSSEGESSSSSVRFIMDSLRCIDKTELDYISPLSPGPSHAIPDLEQELALSGEAWSDKLPPASPLFPDSPSSAYADSAPNTPSNDHHEYANGFEPVISEQEVKELTKSAVKAIKKKCSTDVVLRAAKRVACQRAEDLCRKDPDGDTFFMIVVCKPSDSPNFYENLFVMQQHLQKLRVCCDQPIEAGGMESCTLCGAGPESWRTPLSETNNAGDSVLSCAVKMGHPEEVINFLCAGVAGCPEDMRRMFGDAGRHFLAVYTNMYPVLSRFL